MINKKILSTLALNKGILIKESFLCITLIREKASDDLLYQGVIPQVY